METRHGMKILRKLFWSKIRVKVLIMGSHIVCPKGFAKLITFLKKYFLKEATYLCTYFESTRFFFPSNCTKFAWDLIFF